MNYLEDLSNELFDNILHNILSQRDLNHLSKTSRTLYHRSIPKLYRSWSYFGLQQELKPLKQFLETINWRPDLAAYVKELDIREWGNCRRLEDCVGSQLWENYQKRQKEEALKKELEEKENQRESILDDALIGEDDEEQDETYSESESEGYSDDNDCEEELESDEAESLGPIAPFTHEKCGNFKGGCEHSIEFFTRQAGHEFDQDDVIFQYSKILFEENEDALVALLLSKLPNLTTLWMVMKGLDQYEQEESPLCKFLENTTDLEKSGALQKLETLYICSPMILGFNDYREYEIDLRQILPFMRLPSMRSLYTLSSYMFWENRSPPLDFTSLKLTSNITTLVYDESVLNPSDVINSLIMFKSLKSFRWTTLESPNGEGIEFSIYQDRFGNALMAHRDSLEEFYYDNRHNNASTLIGSLREYERLRSLAIDVNSLCGHQKWTIGPPLRDTLPPTLESLTLFVKVHQNETTEGVKETIFDNALWYLNFLDLIDNVTSRLPRLRHVSIQLTGEKPQWPQTEYKLELNLSIFQQAISACAAAKIVLDVQVAVQVNLYKPRKVGLTTIPYFLDQIKIRNPGRDF